MSKEEDLESKKLFMYVNDKIRSSTHVAFPLRSSSTFWKYSYLFYTF